MEHAPHIDIGHVETIITTRPDGPAAALTPAQFERLVDAVAERIAARDDRQQAAAAECRVGADPRRATR